MFKKFYKFWANDFLFYGFLIFFIIFLGQLPVILHFLHTPQGYYYPLLDKVSYSDFYYLALIRFGMGGDWLLQIPYVIVSHKASLIQIFYIFLGKISLATGLGPAETFAVFRVLGGFLFAISAICLFKILFTKNQARLAFVFFLLSQPWPIFRGYLSSLWLQEFNKWIWHFGEAARRISTAPPHYTVGKGLTVLSLVLLILFIRKKKVIYSVFAGLLVFSAGIIYPPPVFILVFSLMVAGGICLLLSHTTHTGCVKHTPGVWVNLFFYLFAAILSLLILKMELAKGFPWDGWNRVELGWNDPSMKFEWEYIHMLGVLVLLVPIGVLSVLKRGISSLSNLGYLRVFIFVWFFSSFLLFPFADALKLGKFRFTEGAQIIPLTVLSVWGFTYLSQKIKKFKYIFLAFFVLNFAFFTVLSLIWSAKSLWGYWTNVYIRPEEVSALKFLDKFVPEGSVVLSHASASNMIPAFARVKTIIGFSDVFPEYKKFEAEEAKIDNILSGKAKEKEVGQYLGAQNVNYVYVDKTVYGVSSPYPQFYKSVFKNKFFEIFKVDGY